MGTLFAYAGDSPGAIIIFFKNKFLPLCEGWGTESATQVLALNGESNPKPFGAWADTLTIEQHWPGQEHSFDMKLPNSFPKRLCYFTFPPATPLGSGYLLVTSSPAFGIVGLFNWSCSDGRVVVSHYGFNSHLFGG